MKHLVFFLEEESAKRMLAAVVPKLVPAETSVDFIVFQGKQDLESNLGRKLRNWSTPQTAFMVLRDRDSEDCLEAKRRLLSICRASGHPETLVRIACGELESFYLGQLQDVAETFGVKVSNPNAAKWRNPDHLGNAAQELGKLTRKRCQKLSGSSALAPRLRIDGSNRSHSFNILVSGIKRMIAS